MACMFVQAVNFPKLKSLDPTLLFPLYALPNWCTCLWTQWKPRWILTDVFISPVSLALRLSPFRPNLSPEEVHSDERFTESVKLILRSCLHWLRADTAVAIRWWLLMGKWWLLYVLVGLSIIITVSNLFYLSSAKCFSSFQPVVVVFWPETSLFWFSRLSV